jgi:hypothetical protein
MAVRKWVSDLTPVYVITHTYILLTNVSFKSMYRPSYVRIPVCALVPRITHAMNCCECNYVPDSAHPNV